MPSAILMNVIILSAACCYQVSLLMTMLSCHYTEWHYAEWQYAEWHYAEWHYAEWHYAEWHYAECVILIVFIMARLV